MVGGILFIVGLYGIGIAAVHLAWFIHHRPKGAQLSAVKPLRYIFICCNHEHVIEWYLRSFLLYAWLKGETFEIAVVDRGSTDNTLRIIERFAHRGAIHVIDEQTYEANPVIKEHSIVVELGLQGEIGNMPFPG